MKEPERPRNPCPNIQAAGQKERPGIMKRRESSGFQILSGIRIGIDFTVLRVDDSEIEGRRHFIRSL